MLIRVSDLARKYKVLRRSAYRLASSCTIASREIAGGLYVEEEDFVTYLYSSIHGLIPHPFKNPPIFCDGHLVDSAYAEINRSKKS